MAIIICFLIVLSVFFDILKVKSNIFYWFLGGLLVLLATFGNRQSFPDYYEYVEAYEYGSERFEVTFSILNALANKLGSISWLFFFYASISVFSKLYVIKKMSKHYWASIAVYLSYFFVLHDLIQIRAGAASGLLLLALFYYTQNKRLKCFFMICIASLFHVSAIIGLVILFFSFIPYNKKMWILFLFTSFVVAGFTAVIIPDSLYFLDFLSYYLHYADEAYINEHGTANLFSVQQLLRYFFYYLIMYRSNYVFEAETNLALFKTFFIATVLFCFLSFIPAAAFRLSDLLYPVEILILPNLLVRLKTKVDTSAQEELTITFSKSYLFLLLLNMVIIVFISFYLSF